MALSKDIQKRGGASANYHRIISIAHNASSDEMSLSVSHYLNHDYRVAHPVDAMQNDFYQMPASGLKSYSGNIYAFAYDYLKSLPEFSGASDC